MMTSIPNSPDTLKDISLVEKLRKLALTLVPVASAVLLAAPSPVFATPQTSSPILQKEGLLGQQNEAIKANHKVQIINIKSTNQKLIIPEAINKLNTPELYLVIQKLANLPKDSKLSDQEISDIYSVLNNNRALIHLGITNLFEHFVPENYSMIGVISGLAMYLPTQEQYLQTPQENITQAVRQKILAVSIYNHRFTEEPNSNIENANNINAFGKIDQNLSDDQIDVYTLQPGKYTVTYSGQVEIDTKNIEIARVTFQLAGNSINAGNIKERGNKATVDFSIKYQLTFQTESRFAIAKQGSLNLRSRQVFDGMVYATSNPKSTDLPFKLKYSVNRQ